MSPIPPAKLSIVVINLPTRTDRRQAAIEELARLGVAETGYQIVAAKHTPQNGAMGCALSHAMVLAQWLFESEDEFCLVLEDDFAVRSPDAFWGMVGQAFMFNQGWDVFLLASNVAVPIEATPIANVFRVINGQTTSAYLVTRRYAPTLIHAFFKAAELFRVYGNVPTLQNQTIQKALFAIDSVWKSHQLDDRYWACLPQVCLQRPSFSDVENRFTDYGV